MSQPVPVTSADNPLLKELRLLARDGAAYRKTGRVWLEGDHLCRAALARGWQASVVVVSESIAPAERSRWCDPAPRSVLISDALFSGISGLKSPATMGFVVDVPVATELQAHLPTVILDRCQDAGNVGSILRSASAFGFSQVLAIKGTAALWSPKVLRAGMGAHFGLQLHEGLELSDLTPLQLPLACTSSHRGQFLGAFQLPQPCAWVFGHEGQGVSLELEQKASWLVRIDQPGGEESLNVAAAAAICLHASASGVRVPNSPMR